MLIVLGCGILSTTVASCGGDDSSSIESLPLLTTTVATVAPETATTTVVPQAEEFYTIQRGDTLYGIAKSFGVKVEDLVAFNGITDPDAIQAGQRLKIPPAGTAIATTTTTTTP